jgi:hypothetical protein
MKSYLMIFSIGITLLVLGACTTFPSENQDPAKNNRDTFRKDLAECKEDYPESSAGLHFQRWIDCMKIKGWR